MMLSNELELSLSSAIQIARQSRHEFITVEHLLSALLNNTAASTVIRSCGGSLSQLRRRLEDYLKQYIPHLPEEGAETQPGIGFQRVIQRAILHVQSSGEQEVTGANVLVAIFSEKKSHAVFFLNEQGITRFNAVNFISHGVTRNTQEEMLPPPAQSQEGGNEEVEAGASTLNTYATNLNE
ncbi:MAG TPA: Clp protease N-terminal domain-containing protein, partial [Arenicellales bacterium]|nr:Clp protease N-terminal domain-containing protein [Arenicellales bacterium]